MSIHTPSTLRPDMSTITDRCGTLTSDVRCGGLLMYTTDGNGVLCPFCPKCEARKRHADMRRRYPRMAAMEDRVAPAVQVEPRPFRSGRVWGVPQTDVIPKRRRRWPLVREFLANHPWSSIAEISEAVSMSGKTLASSLLIDYHASVLRRRREGSQAGAYEYALKGVTT